MNTLFAPISSRSPRFSRGLALLFAPILGLLAALPLTASAAPARRPQPESQPQPGVVHRIAPAPAQPSRPDVPNVLPLTPPEPSEAIRAFNLVRAWLDDWTVGEGAPAAASACITLRLEGHVVARVEVVAPENGIGLGTIEAAVAAAIAQVEERVPLSRDALWPERVRQLGRSLRLSLELGGLAIPVDVESFEDAAMLVSPGISGVGARSGAGEAARISLVFPSAMLGAGLDAGAALAGAAAEVLEDSTASLAGAPALRDRGVRFLAFECTWLAEVGDDRTVVILQRGGRVFETRDVSTPLLLDLGGRFAQVLAAPDPDARPSGSSFAAALRAYALVRWSTTPGAGTDEHRAACALHAATLLTDARDGMQGASPGAAALWSMVGAALPPIEQFQRQPDLAVARGSAGEALLRALRDHAQASGPVASMLAWAAASRAGALGDPELVDQADTALRAAYARTPTGEWVSLMPWAGWAELEIADARRKLAGGDGALTAAAALRDIRDLVWRHQLGATDVSGADRDLVGGIVFTRSRQPLPTWHSLRPLAFVATMMGDTRLTQDTEFPGQVLRMLAAARFLRQLCADDAVMTWSRGPAWGVRAATWTDEQPEEATAMGLLFISELLRSLDAVKIRRLEAERATRY